MLLCSLAALVVCSLSLNSVTQPIRILCIGDSITQGRAGDLSKPNFPPTYSYRYDLFKKLVDVSIPAEFVGKHEGGFEGSPIYEPYKGHPFVNHHEAYWGWPTWEVAAKVESNASNEIADIAIVMLGSNDRVEEIGTKKTLEADDRIVAALRSANPKIKIIFGLPYQPWKPFPTLTKALREFAQKNSTSDSPIISVDPPANWVSEPTLPGTCTVDWVHPNQTGDDLLANQFYDVIQTIVRRRDESIKHFTSVSGLGGR